MDDCGRLFNAMQCLLLTCGYFITPVKSVHSLTLEFGMISVFFLPLHYHYIANLVRSPVNTKKYTHSRLYSRC